MAVAQRVEDQLGQLSCGGDDADVAPAPGADPVADLPETGVRGNPLDVWVPDSRGTSCDLLIFVEQPAEPIEPSDAVRLVGRPLGEWP